LVGEKLIPKILDGGGIEVVWVVLELEGVIAGTNLLLVYGGGRAFLLGVVEKTGRGGGR